jgi:hypothetical protein
LPSRGLSIFTSSQSWEAARRKPKRHKEEKSLKRKPKLS